ncbi:MAG: putative addiction module antidote protein [Deltaproteobacteria bacterium]|jgi:probable addiction module antidote protein|nr:putative addiction module antidote protein [Deltaproteobacteria bacterium]
MTIKTTPYNPFDYFETKEEINENLNNAFMDDDPRIFIIALGYLTRKKGRTKVARETGLNRESLYKSLAEDGNPKFSTISRITKALGCRQAVI